MPVLQYSKSTKPRFRWFWWPTVLSGLLTLHFLLSAFVWAVNVFLITRGIGLAIEIMTWEILSFLGLLVLSVAMFVFSLLGRDFVRRGVLILLLIVVGCFCFDAYNQNWQSIGFPANAPLDYWEEGGKLRHYYTWWWFNDRMFTEPRLLWKSTFVKLTLLWILLPLIFLPIAFLSTVEKRFVQPYVEVYINELREHSKPAQLAISTAEEFGCTPLATRHHCNSKLIKVRYDFWLSHDRAIILIIGSGTVTGISLTAFWIYSRLQVGPILMTTNMKPDQDISGIVKQQTWPGSAFAPLYQKHLARIESANVLPFSADRAFDEILELIHERIDALVARGYARYLDERSVWKLTLKGAIVSYFVTIVTAPIQRAMRTMGLRRE